MQNNLKRTFLKEKRKKMELTQEKVASLLGISRTYYGQIENGTRSPGLALASRIAKLFRINIQKLINK